MVEVKEMLENAKRAKDSLVYCASFVPKEKWGWKPSPTSRNAFVLLDHAGGSIGMFTMLLKGQKIDFEKMESAGNDKPVKEFAETEAGFQKAWDDFASTVKSLSPADLKKTVELPWGNRTFADLVSDIQFEMNYHFAQMQYLQTIYGDMENHFKM